MVTDHPGAGLTTPARDWAFVVDTLVPDSAHILQLERQDCALCEMFALAQGQACLLMGLVAIASVLVFVPRRLNIPFIAASAQVQVIKCGIRADLRRHNLSVHLVLSWGNEELTGPNLLL